MAIKAAGTPLKWSEIQTEFGPTPTSMSNMKKYRDIDPVGGITDLSLDEEYSVGRFPTSGEVKFSDFYGKRLNIIVNYYDALSTDWSLVFNSYTISPVYRIELIVATGVYTYTANNADIGTSTDTTLDLGSTRYSVGDLVIDGGTYKVYKIKIEQKGNARVDAKLKYDSGTIGQDFVVVGGLRGKPGTTAGCKVRIHVNQEIVSAKGNPEICALKTGNWSGDTILAIDVGANGKIYGAGGNGGAGAGGESNGNPGSHGTSALGVQHDCTVNIMNGGYIQAGYGGGGGGGGGYDSDKHDDELGSGGGGGGGAGLPVGSGGNGGDGWEADGEGGDNGGNTTAGEGGNGGNSDNEGIGGNGGDGGSPGENADNGGGGSGNNGTGSGGAKGDNGIAVRRTSGSITVHYTGETDRIIGATNVTGTIS